MKTYAGDMLGSFLRHHGRTFFDGESRAFFFNWTCSGFTVSFRGTWLRGRFLAFGERQPMVENAPMDYPCIGVVGEEGETLIRRYKCTENEAWYELFEGSEGLHTLRIVKLSENMRGKTGLLALETDEELTAAAGGEPGLSIEFIGDSITCGFGNEAGDRDALFDTGEENGWMTYAAVAGRKLGAEFSMISVSGISACRAKYPMFPHMQMEEVYGYRDVYWDERFRREPAPWDFGRHKKDVVVINLGTNDVNPVRFYRELSAADQEEAWFIERYKAFIEKVRRLNGPNTLIVCTLGPMEYYLYDCIEKAVRRYERDAGDRRIACFKLIGINLMTEGFGAVGHPSLKTHIRVGNELAARLEKLMGKDCANGAPQNLICATS